MRQATDDAGFAFVQPAGQKPAQRRCFRGFEVMIRLVANFVGFRITSRSLRTTLSKKPDLFPSCQRLPRRRYGRVKSKSCIEKTSDILVQLAIVHAGIRVAASVSGRQRYRIGRMLIPIYLYDRKLLQSPMFLFERVPGNEPHRVLRSFAGSVSRRRLDKLVPLSPGGFATPSGGK